VGVPAELQQGAPDAPQGVGLLQQACAENITGFERAYLVTFYVSLAALVLGLMLPGWPGPWLGRKDVPEVPAGLH
jgi:hypothetical protein